MRKMEPDAGRSGGKISRGRRIVARRSPYERPTPPPSPPESPNWLNGLVLPVKLVANGAGKLLRSLWNPATWASSSPSSSDTGSEDGAEDEYDDCGVPCDGVNELNQRNAGSSGITKRFGKEFQLSARKGVTMRLIEQLLMLENISREDCDRLTEIINSRVVDCSMKEVLDTVLSEIPNARADGDTHVTSSQVIMEAKKWLEEIQKGSSSKSDLDHGTYAYNSIVKLHGTDDEAGSPVDVAKSYMRACPPWLSPSIKHDELRTGSPKAADFFQEGIPNSKPDCLSAGSWNIQEEIRKLRYKATEDMLSNWPSPKLNFASCSPEHKTTQDSLAADNASMAMKLQESNSLKESESMDKYVNLSGGVNSHGLSVALARTQDGLPSEALPSLSISVTAEQNKDMEVIEPIEEEVAPSKSHEAAGPEVEPNQLTDVTEIEGIPTADGSASSRFNLPSGLERGQIDRALDEGYPSPGISTCDNLADIIPGEGTCELLTETLVEVPTIDETIIIGNGEQSSCSMHDEGFPQELTQANTKPSLMGKTGSPIERQLQKKPSRYSRKGRGRGK